ncbi:MAG TPA: EAL domain-containing protein [Gammaproteobacteria bacterium]|nr:EAL domain-containing protein [Gammaproteobacteria bacterium]
MRQFSFRRKVLLLAVVLVTTVQLVTLFPVLDAIDSDATDRAEKATRLAGVVFDEFMANRSDALRRTARVLVSDFGFKQAVATHEPATIESALQNHAARVGASVALLLDLDGRVIAAAADPAQRAAAEALRIGSAPEGFTDAVVEIGGVSYQAVMVPLQAPVAIAWVLLGFPIDAELALHIENLTGVEVSFVRSVAGGIDVLASTLPEERRIDAFRGVDLRSPNALQETGRKAHTLGFLTLLRPFSPGSADVEVALQLSKDDAMASYRRIRNFLVATTGLSLLLAVGVAIWLANTVTRPVQNLAAAARRMREGIYDEPIEFRSADELGELAAGFNAMQRAIAEREQHIFHQAHHDSLTGLPNRDLALSRLRESVASSSRLSVVSLGLDRFNSVVSSLGHRAGDDLIEQVAGLLRARVKDGQILGHLGGHQFVIALPEHDADAASAWTENTLDLLRAGVRSAGANISLRGVAGVALHPEHGSDAAELMRRASIARTQAQQGPEPIVIYRLGQEDRFLEQIRIVGDFPKALKANELELHFQPQIDCATRRVSGAEALVRWRHPELGLLAPGAFVDAIEQAGGISHLTRWVLREAVRRVAEWRKAGADFGVAANISVDDLVDEYLPYFLLDLIRQQGLTPADITLEITENAIMRNLHKSLAVISCIHELGFRIAVDDFGVGQSALAQLKRLPADELKIDKSFVMNLDAKDEAIVRSTIELAHHLELAVVAEGVETAETLARLSELGCENAQGYHIAAPLPADRLLPWVEEWARRPAGAVLPFEKRKPTS